VPPTGKGGKNRANAFFNLGKPGEETGKAVNQPAQPSEPPAPPEPEAPRGEPEKPELPPRISLLRTGGLSRSAPLGSLADDGPPGQVRIETDPRAESGAQTRGLDVRFKVDRTPEGGEEGAFEAPLTSSAPEDAPLTSSAPEPPGASKPEPTEPASTAASVDVAPPEKQPAPRRKSLFSVDRGDAPLPRPVVYRPDPPPPPAVQPAPRALGDRSGRDAPTGAGRSLSKSSERGGSMAPADAASGSGPSVGTGGAKGGADRAADPALVAKYEKQKARLAESPEDGDLLMRFGSLCADMGRKEEALETFRAALKAQPENGFVRQRLRELGGDEDVKAAEADSGRGPFSGAVAEFLAYPFRGHGISILIIGGIFFGLASAVISYSMFVGLTLRLTVTGYLAAFQFRAVQLSAQGKREPPDWPDFSDAPSDAMRMFGCYAASFGPAFVLFLCAVFSFNASRGGDAATVPSALSSPAFGGGHGSAGLSPAARAFEERKIAEGMPPAEARAAALEEFGEDGGLGLGAGGPHIEAFGGIGDMTSDVEEETTLLPSISAMSRAGMPLSTGFFLLLCLIASVAGSAYLPLALLITTIFNTSRPAFGYPFAIDTARRIWTDYAVCAGICVASFIALSIVGAILRFLFGILVPVPLLGPLLESIVFAAFSLYQTLAISHLIGRLYFHNESKIGWLSR